jgi:hypothetical protein
MSSFKPTTDRRDDGSNWPMLSKKPKIERLRKSREVGF